MHTRWESADKLRFAPKANTLSLELLRARITWSNSTVKYLALWLQERNIVKYKESCSYI